MNLAQVATEIRHCEDWLLKADAKAPNFTAADLADVFSAGKPRGLRVW